jgi:DNA-binding phage protein
MIKSRVGLLLGVAALLLALSPEARRTVRRWAVKGTEGVLDITEIAKDAGAAAQHKLQSLSARSEPVISSDRGPLQ